MGKGRATTTYTINHRVTPEGDLLIEVNASGASDEYFDWIASEANGTVALGKAIAEIGKLATPITSKQAKVAALVADMVAEGISKERATELASKF